jgi:hypothetical protein
MQDVSGRQWLSRFIGVLLIGKVLHGFITARFPNDQQLETL